MRPVKVRGLGLSLMECVVLRGRSLGPIFFGALASGSALAFLSGRVAGVTERFLPRVARTGDAIFGAGVFLTLSLPRFALTILRAVVGLDLEVLAAASLVSMASSSGLRRDLNIVSKLRLIAFPSRALTSFS